MAKLVEILSEEKIKAKVCEIASLINESYKGKDFMIVSVLKGSFIFTADLVREINIPVEIAFMAASSYGSSTESSGSLKIRYDVDIPVKDKNILLVEDIVDTGLTINVIKKYLEDSGAKDVKICTIFDKPERRVVDVKVDFCGFVIPNEFVVGYGLDYNNKYRNVRNLCKIEL